MPRAIATTLVTTTLMAVLIGCASLTRPPQFVGGKDFVYPAHARASGVEGRVLVRYDITVAGTVADAVVVKSEPPGVFDEAALDAVRSWRFRPMVDRGEVVPAPARVSELVFRLGESSYADLPAPGRDAE
ncbi:MAG: energy transducer TonB [Gammaproteobacteria bacterium]|nr:energy transducer TonB [Gammaproteobacteria bacterium]MDE0442544.1 energy transducer TonB [Gammaproteobacteria bacterium]